MLRHKYLLENLLGEHAMLYYKYWVEQRSEILKHCNLHIIIKDMNNRTVFLDTKHFEPKRIFEFEYELWVLQNNINFKKLLKYFLLSSVI
jgi:hypothetical protein